MVYGFFCNTTEKLHVCYTDICGLQSHRVTNLPLKKKFADASYPTFFLPWDIKVLSTSFAYYNNIPVSIYVHINLSFSNIFFLKKHTKGYWIKTYTYFCSIQNWFPKVLHKWTQSKLPQVVFQFMRSNSILQYWMLLYILIFNSFVTIYMNTIFLIMKEIQYWQIFQIKFDKLILKFSQKRKNTRLV